MYITHDGKTIPGLECYYTYICTNYTDPCVGDECVDEGYNCNSDSDCCSDHYCTDQKVCDYCEHKSCSITADCCSGNYYCTDQNVCSSCATETDYCDEYVTCCWGFSCIGNVCTGIL